MRKRKVEVHVAVVCKGPGRLGSGRPQGDWASFLAPSRADAIARALRAIRAWGGEYVVLVGELTGRAKWKNEFEVVKLGRED